MRILAFWFAFAFVTDVLSGDAIAQIGQASPHQMTIGQPTQLTEDPHVVHQLPGNPSMHQLHKVQHPHVVPPSQRPGSGNVLIPGGVLK